MSQATVGSHCADCAKAARPDVATRARFWQARQPAIVATTLIAVNVLVFLAVVVFTDPADALGGASTQAHVDFALFDSWRTGVLGNRFRVSDGGDWYRLVTSGFMHFGVIHLALNMYFLFVLGNSLEPTIGRIRFAALYFASLLGGSAGALIIDQGGLTAGASGAVFGLMGAMAVGFWHRGINPFSTQIGTLLLLNLGLTFFLSDRISVGGHVGGLVAGSICGFVLMAPHYKGVPAWAAWVTPPVIAAVSIALSYVVVA